MHSLCDVNFVVERETTNCWSVTSRPTRRLFFHALLFNLYVRNNIHTRVYNINYRLQIKRSGGRTFVNFETSARDVLNASDTRQNEQAKKQPNPGGCGGRETNRENKSFGTVYHPVVCVCV